MNNKNVNPKKTLVRNVRQRNPIIKVTKEYEPTQPLKTDEKKTNHTRKSNKCAIENQISLSTPSVNASKALAKQILDLKKPPKDKICKYVPDEALNEKITKKMNFRLDENIYKDLIPLRISTTSEKFEKKETLRPVSAEDLEPKLEDFIRRKKFKDFFYEVQSTPRVVETICEYDGLKTFRLMQEW